MGTFARAERLRKLPPYLFAEIDKMKAEARKRGVELISFGIGDPDLPTPGHIIRALQKAAENPQNHQYPDYEGTPAFREAVATWYRQRFGVALDPETEVLSLIGSKEGIGHIPLAFIDPGDVVLVPDPGYPVYHAGTLFAGGESYPMPLLRSNHFLPDLSAIPSEIVRRAKMMFLNYPNNPTAAVATQEFLQEVFAFARQHGIILCHDAAYSEIAFDGYRPPSLLSVEGAKEVGIEFHSLSKTYNMTGWRIGFAVGNAEIIAGLGAIKTNLDSGIFKAVQEAGVAALTGDQTLIHETCQIYQRRRDLLVDGLKRLGWEVEKPKATFYLWVPVPPGYTSKELTVYLIKEAGIVTTPGVGFGPHGEGFLRLALTVSEPLIREALQRMERLKL
ncbi:MAG: LL-diaminopimelate aminotransferase [Nitrospinota bacterium]|nr:MAG: LL-diaminopimelate aminotransferase [Nitrospinota bacterium]